MRRIAAILAMVLVFIHLASSQPRNGLNVKLSENIVVPASRNIGLATGLGSTISTWYRGDYSWYVMPQISTSTFLLPASEPGRKEWTKLVNITVGPRAEKYVKPIGIIFYSYIGTGVQSNLEGKTNLNFVGELGLYIDDGFQFAAFVSHSTQELHAPVRYFFYGFSVGKIIF